ncbi:PAS domain-containing hybrid sensor histidine kinase/response regulator [Alkalimarinus coralli]|uniref:PAS domain-containing hybrid sensor histidine kinase/response regulator n=1 Tax=Alkalimarinus coralli TaxID=2935863 RepID=UPI00202AFDDF|nr:PAS domain-containing hybrid sensor histidine kinase/response regulator [Alkalimarinus coralli]
MDISVKTFINQGISPDSSSSLAKCVRLCNLAAYTLAVGLIPYLFLYWHHQLYTAFSTVFFLVLFNASIPYVNQLGYNKLARTSFVIVNYALGFVNSTLLGQETFVFLYLVVGLPVSVMLFRFREYGLQTLCLGIASFLIVLDLVFCVAPFFRYELTDSALEHIRVTVVLGSLSCSFLFILFFRYESGSAQRNFEQLVVSKQIIKNDLDAVFFCDMAGHIKLANQAAEKLSGYALNELIGMKLSAMYRDPEIIGADDNLSVNSPSSTTKEPWLMACEQRNWHGETELQMRDGYYVTALVSQFVVTDEEGRPVGIAVTAKNITRQKQTELALIEAKEKAEEAAIVKANFLATMSHEIRTPLNGVIGMAQLLLEDDPKPEHVESLNILKFAAENLLTLINDVLDFSKIDAGRITLETVPFCLAELVNSIKNSSQYLACEKGIEFKVSLDNQLDEMYQTDPVRLTQVLLNLTSNAIKFTKVGGVTLSVAIVRSDESEADIAFKVSDTGIGIAQDKLGYIFEQFSQADSTITRHYGGSGLGLSITKGLLEAFGADIEVESEEGKGTTFSFTLTMKKVLDGAPSSASKGYLDNRHNPDLNEELAGLSILVAEDNPVNVMVIRKWLTKWRVELDIVKNGEEAVQRVREKTYDLVLMDIQMPVMDGFQATLAIRSLMKGAPLPIIALTATTTDEFVAEAYNVGMNGYLGKPFNPNHLKSKIMELCLVQPA